MFGRLALRVAAVASLLLTLAHTVGFTTPGHDAAQFATRRVMESAAFNLGGSMRTYWDLYVGFGLIISAVMTAQAVVLWLLAANDKRHPGEGRAIIWVLFASNVAVLGLDWRYLFAGAVIGAALIVAAIGAAALTVGRSAVQPRDVASAAQRG